MSTLLDPQRDTDELLLRLETGQVGVVPTDTAYGLAASVEFPDSVWRVFSVKDRSPEKTIPLLASRDWVDDEFPLTDVEQRAVDAFWPGALTLVTPVESSDSYPQGLVREGTLAVRVPAHEPLLTLLRKVGPVTGTSANPTGEETPGSIDAVHYSIVESVDFLMKGPTVEVNSSTVAEWNPEKKTWIVHREGPITLSELNESTLTQETRDDIQ